jgi:hypothetical protein
MVVSVWVWVGGAVEGGAGGEGEEERRSAASVLCVCVCDTRVYSFFLPATRSARPLSAAAPLVSGDAAAAAL